MGCYGVTFVLLSFKWNKCTLTLRQHVALLIKLVAAWFVPDVPQSVKNKVLEEKYRGLQEKLGCRQAGLRPRAPPPTSAPTSSPKSTDV